MFEEISFPENKYDSIQIYLNKLGYCYTTRVYKEIGKYKVGKLYTAPWDDVVQYDYHPTATNQNKLKVVQINCCLIVCA